MPCPRRLAMRRFALTLACCTMAIGSPSPTTAQQPEVYTGIVEGVAVGGYDPVAYFTQGEPVVGKPEISHQHAGVTWRFATEESWEAFKAEPSKYAPQYGGYCAWAVARNYTAKGDPMAWSIVGDRLFLNYNQWVKRIWERDKPGNISKGDANWPKVLEK